MNQAEASVTIPFKKQYLSARAFTLSAGNAKSVPPCGLHPCCWPSLQGLSIHSDNLVPTEKKAMNLSNSKHQTTSKPLKEESGPADANRAVQQAVKET